MTKAKLGQAQREALPDMSISDDRSPRLWRIEPTTHLDQWPSIVVAEGTIHLVGIVYGHQRLRDGARIVTSPVIGIDASRSCVETCNTLYQLKSAGQGPLPEEWAERVDDFLLRAWHTQHTRFAD
jgi:hypothetical protein